MTVLEAIKVRHSIRHYIDRKIEAEKVEKLNKLINECNEEGNLHLQLCEDAAGTFTKFFNKTGGLGSAPSVIACVGPDDETLEERIGYYGQKVVIYAQRLGLNTCWAGTYSKKKCPAEVRPGEKSVIAIAIGYGENQGKERKSKSFKQVTSGKIGKPEWFLRGVEAALLAPTAINQQRFEIKLKDDETVEFIDKGGIMGKIDLGIVKYNFEIGSEH